MDSGPRGHGWINLKYEGGGGGGGGRCHAVYISRSGHDLYLPSTAT